MEQIAHLDSRQLQEEHNSEDVEDGLRNFLGGEPQRIQHPNRERIQKRMVEENMNDEPFEHSDDGYRAQPRHQPKQGFRNGRDLLRQFRTLMLSEEVAEGSVDVEDLKFSLEDCMDMVELFTKQRDRRQKQKRVTKNNRYVKRGLNDDVYDVLDDDDDVYYGV